MKHGLVCNMCMPRVMRPVVWITNYKMREFLMRMSGNLIPKFDGNENGNERKRCEHWHGNCYRGMGGNGNAASRSCGAGSNCDAIAACCGIGGACLAASERERVRALFSGQMPHMRPACKHRWTCPLWDLTANLWRHASVLSQRRPATTTGGPGDTERDQKSLVSGKMRCLGTMESLHLNMRDNF